MSSPNERNLSVQEALSSRVSFPPVNRTRAGDHDEELPRLIGLAVRTTYQAFSLGLIFDTDGDWNGWRLSLRAII